MIPLKFIIRHLPELTMSQPFLLVRQVKTNCTVVMVILMLLGLIHSCDKGNGLSALWPCNNGWEKAPFVCLVKNSQKLKGWFLGCAISRQKAEFLLLCYVTKPIFFFSFVFPFPYF
jgi:hypothetical protein